GVSDAEAATGASAPAARQGRQRWAVLTESLILTPDPPRERLRASRRWVFFFKNLPARRRSGTKDRRGGSSGSGESEGERLSSAAAARRPTVVALVAGAVAPHEAAALTARGRVLLIHERTRHAHRYRLRSARRCGCGLCRRGR